MTPNTRLVLAQSIALIFLALRSGDSYPVGLGPLRLQSALGQPLRASVQVLGSDARTLTENCIRSRLTATDGSEILRPDIELRRVGNSAAEITVSSNALIDEPAVTLLVEITCVPTLHREYQLLLDLKDGLPRVVGMLSGSSMKAPLVGGMTKVLASAEEPRKKRRASRRTVTPKAQTALDTQQTSASFDETTPARPRAKGLPGSRNVLKLSQDDLDLGVGPTKAVATLKLTDNLSATEGRGALINSEEISAAKARFQAMMRDEDPLVLAQKQVRTLTEQLKQSATEGNLKDDKKSGSESSAFMRGIPDLNKWMIGLAGLLLAAIGVVVAMVKPTKAAKSAAPVSPWWQAGSESGSREVDLLKSAREANRVQKAGVFAEDVSRLQANMAAEGEDAALERYVSQYVRIKPGADEPDSSAPFEAALVASTPQLDVQAAVARQPVLQSVPLAMPVDQSANDAAGELLTVDPRYTKLATFEEVSDVMQEAEFWKMLNETQRAIDILEHYCGAANGDSPVPWLYLFDLYVESGEVARHADLRERFQAKFNSQIPETGYYAESGQQSLEDYPYLMEQISALWGQNDVVAFLQSLLLNSRDEPRQGFDLLVYREILLLIEVARERDKLAA